MKRVVKGYEVEVTAQEDGVLYVVIQQAGRDKFAGTYEAFEADEGLSLPFAVFEEVHLLVEEIDYDLIGGAEVE